MSRRRDWEWVEVRSDRGREDTESDRVYPDGTGGRLPQGEDDERGCKGVNKRRVGNRVGHQWNKYITEEVIKEVDLIFEVLPSLERKTRLHKSSVDLVKRPSLVHKILVGN